MNDATTGSNVPFRHTAAAYVCVVVLGAAFPRWFHCPGRLRGRALARYVARVFVVTFVGRQWVRPWEQRRDARRDAARAKLATELGREPTLDEMHAELIRRRE